MALCELRRVIVERTLHISVRRLPRPADGSVVEVVAYPERDASKAAASPILDSIARWLVRAWIAMMLLLPLVAARLVHPDGQIFLNWAFDNFGR